MKRYHIQYPFKQMCNTDYSEEIPSLIEKKAYEKESKTIRESCLFNNSFLIKELIERFTEINKSYFKNILFHRTDMIDFINEDELIYYEFYITIDQRLESFKIHMPEKIGPDVRYLYPNYRPEMFKDNKASTKLKWLASYCMFIPVCIYHEDLHDSKSHLFCHIKGNEDIMAELQESINESPYPPNDKVYYFIGESGSNLYLSRDLQLSPRPDYTTWKES